MPHLARPTSPSVAAHIAELHAVIAAQRGWTLGAMQVSAALDEIARQSPERAAVPPAARSRRRGAPGGLLRAAREGS